MSPKAMMVLSRFLSMLISVFLLRNAVATVTDSVLVSAIAATNQNGSDDMRSADQRDDFRDLLIKSYGVIKSKGQSQKSA